MSQILERIGARVATVAVGAFVVAAVATVTPGAQAQSPGSLWGQPGSRSRSAIADRTALEVGDLESAPCALLCAGEQSAQETSEIPGGCVKARLRRRSLKDPAVNGPQIACREVRCDFGRRLDILRER